MVITPADSPQFYEIIGRLIHSMSSACVLVGHNFDTDLDKLGRNIDRYCPWMSDAWKTVTSRPRFDTCKNAPAKMKLSDLYKHLTGEKMTGEHNAGCDATAAYKCYLEMQRQKKVN